MNHAGRSPNLLRIRRAAFFALRVVVAAAGASLLLALNAGATGPTTITFNDATGLITDQYQGQGVRFGTASHFGVTLGGAWDCGPPTGFVQFFDGPPFSRTVALAPRCSGRSGTVMAFANPRKSIRLLVGETSPTDRRLQLRAYDRTGGLVANLESGATETTLAIERQSPDVKFVAVQLTGEGTDAVLFDDLTFDHLGDPLTVTPRDFGAIVGIERSGPVAHLKDEDPTAAASDYQARIEWGDGGTSTGQLTSTGDGYDVVGSHTYGAKGTLSVRTTVEKVNGVRATATSTAQVADRPDFSVSVSPSAARVSQGKSGRFTVTVTPLAGFAGTVALSLTGPGGSFAPPSVSVPGSSQLTVPTSKETAPGAYPLTVTATGGGLSRTATATLTVTKAAPAVVAAFSVPKPSTVLSLVTLDARRSIGASRYLWDLTGDRKPDVQCGKNTPVLATRLRTPGRRTVSLTAVALDGKTSVARKTLTLGKRSRRGQAGRLELARCLRDPRNKFEVTCTRATEEKVVFGLVDARGCFTRATGAADIPEGERAVFSQYRGDPALADPLVSRQSVRINGITFTPARGASIVVFPQVERIVSSRAEIRLGGISVRGADAVNLALGGGIVRRGFGKAAGKALLLTFRSTQLLPELGGFRLAGDVDLSLVRRGASYTSEALTPLALPKELTLFGGTAPVGRTVFVADNDGGLVLDELSLRVPEANFGAIRMTDLSFAYKASGNRQAKCSRRWWKATVNVFLGSEDDGGFRAAPEPQKNGVAFCDGSFKEAAAELIFPAGARPQLFPGIELRSINALFGLDPTLVRGGATISVARLSEVAGTLLMAYPSPATPYTVERGDGIEQLVGRVFTAPTIAVEGDFSLPVLGRTIRFGNAYVAYSYPDFVAAGGSVRLLFPGVTATIGVAGEMWLSKAIFDFRGSGELCLAGLACLLRADAWVSSTGFVACGEIAGELHPGAGYRWGDALPTVWLVDGCTPSQYWPQRPGTSVVLGPYAAQATRTFTVQRGERVKEVRLDGLGAAPRVEVRGPKGEIVSTASGDFVAGRTIRILRQDATRVTWIGVANAAPGTYTVKTLPGSAGIARVATTRNDDEHVRATVSGKGAKRVLRYDVARVPGRRVTFFERGRSSYRRLGTVTGGRGVLRFTPAAGTGGRREIVAVVQLDGVPTPDRVVARFTVVSPARLVRPGALEVRRSRSTVLASWRNVTGATGYAVVLRLRSGAERVVRVQPSRTSVRFRAIPLTDAGAVSVRATGPLGRWGPAAEGRFAAPKRMPSPFLPYSELGRRSRR